MKILISKQEVDNIPNDQELGSYIRKKFQEKISYSIVVDEADNMRVVTNTENNESEVHRERT